MKLYASSKHVLFDAGKKHIAYVRSALSKDGTKQVPYLKGWAWQHVLLERRLNHVRMQQQLQKHSEKNHLRNDMEMNEPLETAHDNDWLLLFEHEAVYTLGRGAREEHLTFLNKSSLITSKETEDHIRRLSRNYRGDDSCRLRVDATCNKDMSVENEVDAIFKSQATQSKGVFAPTGAPIYRIERGGEVTYHGPGQLVFYPMLNLRDPAYKQDLHWYLRQLEEVVILTLQHFDIKSNRDNVNTGVWVGQEKIAAVGVSSSRWITTHGMAINVNPNLDCFDREVINPCGIKGRGVTSIRNVLKGCHFPSVSEVADVAVGCFGKVFNIEIVEGRPIC